MKVAVFNLGCKVNQYECDVISEKLFFDGHNVVQDMERADAYILNTCAVTAEAERKSRQAVARCRALNPDAKIFILGCASQKNPESFIKDGVTYISGTAGKFAVTERLSDDGLTMNSSVLPNSYESGGITKPHRTRTFVKIQDGCDHFCSYCIIPYLRGRSRSRNIDEVVKEVSILADKTAEIVLTGVDIMAFGKDSGSSLTELMRALSGVDVRIRLGSVYAEKITEELLDAAFGLKKFCPHFHLSLQSGDDKVLKDMNRHYTAQDYLDKIRLIRKYDSLSAITTDVIVGFPTETEEAFVNTRNFVREAAFSDLHIFPFSARGGTRAASLTPLPSEVVRTRKKILSEEKQLLHNAFLQANTNREHEVIIEEEKDGLRVGYSRNYIRIYTERNGGDVVITHPSVIYKDGLKEV